MRSHGSQESWANVFHQQTHWLKRVSLTQAISLKVLHTRYSLRWVFQGLFKDKDASNEQRMQELSVLVWEPPLAAGLPESWHHARMAPLPGHDDEGAYPQMAIHMISHCNILQQFQHIFMGKRDPLDMIAFQTHRTSFLFRSTKTDQPMSKNTLNPIINRQFRSGFQHLMNLIISWFIFGLANICHQLDQ